MNPFNASRNTDKEDREQEALVTYGEFDIELRVTFEIKSEDNGIGWHDCGGHMSFHSDVIQFVEEVNSIELMTQTKESLVEANAYCKKYHKATKEERNIMLEAGERFPKIDYYYTGIKINDIKEEQLIEAINEAI